jgi:hypothetical protein
LESLPLSDGSLLGSHYYFVRLSSARELVKMKSANNANEANTAVLYGGLQYDLEATVMAEESMKYDLSNLLAMRKKRFVEILSSMICKEQKRKS